MRHYTRSSAPRHLRPLRMLGCCTLACGLALCTWQAMVRHSYQRLSVASSPPLIQEALDATDIHESNQTMQRNWYYLRACNDNIAAWVSVEGTAIDLPVVSTTGKSPDFYLTHDFWGRWALEGTPYLDERCQADGMHRLVYGHHLSTGGQFSELQKAYEAEHFQKFGPCHWETPSKGELSLIPLCSMKVDASYQPIQAFEFATSDDLHAWLTGLAEEAPVRAPSWQELAATARSAVTLVTCASDRAGQRARTLVTFVEVYDTG